MSAVKIDIPGQPFAWQRAIRLRDGRTINSKAMIANQRHIAAVAGKAWGGEPPLFGPVAVLVFADFEIPAGWPQSLIVEAYAGRVYHDSKPDADNLAKEIADALKFIAYCDDSQIADTRCVKRYTGAPGTQIWIKSLATLETAAMRRRARRWRSGAMNAAIAKAPCGAARMASVLYGNGRSRDGKAKLI